MDHQDPLAIADALEGILRDGTASNGMRERSRALAAELSWSRVGTDYLDLADRLWRGHPIAGSSQDRLVVA